MPERSLPVHAPELQSFIIRSRSIDVFIAKIAGIEVSKHLHNKIAVQTQFREKTHSGANLWLEQSIWEWYQLENKQISAPATVL